MKKLLTVICTLTLLAMSAAAFAQQEEGHPYFTEKFQISAGAFFPNFDTAGRLDGDNGLVGTDIDFESLLALDENMVTPYAEVMWRFKNKHRLTFDYVNLDRDGFKNLSATINFGDQTYTAGLNVDSEIKLSIYRLGYEYSFINDGNKEFGLGLDVDVMSVEASIAALGGAIESESAVVPVPTLGFHGAYKIADKFVLFGNFKGLYFDIGNANGSVLNFVAGVEHDTFENFSVGAAYAYYNADVDIDASGFNGSLDIAFHGPLAYAKLHF